MKIVTIIGARPQFIKAAPVSRILRQSGHEEYLCHTGQHYDVEMSKVFFEELAIPDPDVNLGVGSGSHGWQTGQMLIKVEEVLLSQKPDWVLVYGDTNSTLAGSLAACKLGVPLAHVEAGLRSFNREMAEEHNRVVTDHVADLLFCPTKTAVINLEREGITKGVHLVGDVMYDSLLYNGEVAESRSRILEMLNLQKKGFALVTVYRAENTDDPERLESIFWALNRIGEDGLDVVVPLHPRTRKKLRSLMQSLKSLKLIDPVSYMDILLLEKEARVILTDSGGIQKEAYWFGVPCVTLRDETEWVETVNSGWNVLVGAESERILKATRDAKPGSSLKDDYGDGKAAEKIREIISSS